MCRSCPFYVILSRGRRRISNTFPVRRYFSNGVGWFSEACEVSSQHVSKTQIRTFIKTQFDCCSMRTMQSNNRYLSQLPSRCPGFDHFKSNSTFFKSHFRHVLCLSYVLTGITDGMKTKDVAQCIGSSCSFYRYDHNLDLVNDFHANFRIC